MTLVDLATETPIQACLRRWRTNAQADAAWEPDAGDIVELGEWGPARLLYPRGVVLGVIRFATEEPRYLVEVPGARAFFTLTELRVARMAWTVVVPWGEDPERRWEA